MHVFRKNVRNCAAVVQLRYGCAAVGGLPKSFYKVSLMKNRFVLMGLVLLLSACAANDQSRVTSAAMSPLNDLNLVKADIPAVLVEAQQQPYAVPVEASCETLLAQVKALDAVLGPDLDAPASDDDPSLIERGSNEAKNAAVGALRSTTEGVVPFRGWVRKLTGAERYSKKVAAAIAAGTVRRAFLKGLMVPKACK
jgi:hypothetical protein